MCHQHPHKKIFFLFSIISLFVFYSIPGLSEEKIGADIYELGKLSNGQDLVGVRKDLKISGADAACMNCHRKSGMGSVEGNIQAPPITGRFLFRSDDRLFATMDPRSGKRFNQYHDPYNEKSLALAITQGINVNGQPMSELMPRYPLSDQEIKSLTGYLTNLSKNYSPGVDAEKIHFATIVTPGVSEKQKQILVSMLNAIFGQKNGSTITGRSQNRRHMVTAAQFVLGTEKKWDYELWQLEGDPSQWANQLEKFYEKKPVFAVLSGIGSDEWDPISQFCEIQKIPCLFPSLNFASEKNNNYSVYFQKGIPLEIDGLLNYLKKNPVSGKFIEIHTNEKLTQLSSNYLKNKLTESRLEQFNLDELSNEDTQQLLRKTTNNDLLILNLSPNDLTKLSNIEIGTSNIYTSGRLLNDQFTSIPPNLVPKLKILYPYELPENRLGSLDYFHKWLRINQMPIENEPLQSEIFFATEFVSDIIADMLDNLYRDYLIERVVDMANRLERGKTEQRERTREGMRLTSRSPRGTEEQMSVQATDIAISEKVKESGMQDQLFGRGTSIYPRLNLSIGQRFASKGIYIVTYEPSKSDLMPHLNKVSDWLIPN
jgi:hypothetical protein